MALSGVVEKSICNGLITFSVEWRVEQDILNSTNTYSYDIYIDTSKCSSAKYVGTGVMMLSATGVPYQYIHKNYSLSRLDAVGKKKLCSTVKGEAIKVGEADINGSIALSGTGEFYAYSDLITYVKSSSYDFGEKITIDGITRATIGEVYGDYVLGNEQTLSITRKRTEFTHKVEYTCGAASGLIRNNSTDETITFTLPVDLALQNTTGTKVSVVFSVTTYYNGTDIGTKTKTVAFTMPESVAPSCSLSVSDAENYTDTYGGYVQRKSRLYINVTPTLAYNSPIVKYEISANDAIYDIQTNTVTTALLKASGKQTVSVIVTDGRGRTGTAEAEIDVLPWSKPDVIKITTFRTDENGNGDSDGEYITAHFDVSVSPLDNKNSATYILAWKKVSGLDQNRETLSNYSGVYSVTDGTYTFKADKDTAYEVTLSVTDDFETGEQTRGGSNAVVLMHFGSDGESMAIGGYATLRGVLDVFFKLRTSGGFMFPTIPNDSLSDCTNPNVYYCDNGRDISGSPTEYPFAVVVLPCGGDEQFTQILITCPDWDSGKIPEIMFRQHRQSSWSTWYKISMTEVD